MSDTITVNGVAFELAETGFGMSTYFNGRCVLTRDQRGHWKAKVATKTRATDCWHTTPEGALNEIDREARSWAPVLREYSRLYGGAV